MRPFCLAFQVEAILVNIFGGIVNCAIIANGITKACRELELKVPLVVRLEGESQDPSTRIPSAGTCPPCSRPTNCLRGQETGLTEGQQTQCFSSLCLQQVSEAAAPQTLTVELGQSDYQFHSQSPCVTEATV